MQPWDQRGCERIGCGGDRQTAAHVQRDAVGGHHQLQSAAVPGISTTGGINFVLEARAGQSYQDLASVSRGLIFAANQNPNLSSVFTSFSASVPQIMVTWTPPGPHARRDAGRRLQTLEANLGSQFVNDFNYQNFVFQVIVQDAAQFRDRSNDIDKLYVQSTNGSWCRSTSLVTISTMQGANAINTYNEYPAVLINGSAAPGSSSVRRSPRWSRWPAASAEGLRL